MSQQGRGAPPPAGGSPALQTVILGNLKSDIDQEALEGLCRKLGRVVSFRLHTSGLAADSPATAVVEYASPEEAAHVVASVKGRLISGQPVTARVASAGANHRQLTTDTPLPGATTAPPPLQHSATPVIAGDDGHSRGPYPVGGLGRRNTNNGAPPKNIGSPAFHGYQRTQQQPPPVDGEVSRKARAGTAGSSASDWESGQGGIPSSRRGVEHPASAVRYSEVYPHSDQQYSSWVAPGGITVAARRSYHDDTIGEPSGYMEGGDTVPYPPPTANARQRQQWHGDTVGRGDSWGKGDSQEWPHNPDDASHYRRGARSGGGANVRSAYPSPPDPSASAWPDEATPQASRAYGSGSHLPPDHRTIPPGSRGPGGPPRRHDIHSHERGRYGNDANGGPMHGNRHRRSPVSTLDGLAMPASDHPSSWNEQAGYATPSLVVPNNDEFDKEVMRQAAKLVAERELAARDEARKKQEQARQQQQQQQNHQQQPKRNERDDWKNDGSLAAAGHRRRQAQDVDRDTDRETRETERVPSTTAPRITTKDRRDWPKRSRSTEERDRATSKSKRDPNDNYRERDRRNQQETHQSQRGEEGSAKRAKRAAAGEDSDRDGRHDGNKRARRDVSPLSKRHKGSGIAGNVTDKKNSSGTSAQSKRELKSRLLPIQQPDRAKSPREDTRARPREDDRAARLESRPHDDQRERERQHSDAKTTAILAKRTPVDGRGGGRVDVSKREDRRVAKVRPAPATSQQDNVTNRERDRKREDHRAGTRSVQKEDDRLDRGRARGSRDNIRTTCTANANIDNTTREWDGATNDKTRPFKVTPRLASADMVNGHPQDAGWHPRDPCRHTQDLDRHPPGVGRHPHGVGRHPQDGGRHPQGVGRHSKEVGRHPQDVGRHPQDTRMHPQDIGRYPQDVGKHPKGVGRHTQDVGKHPQDIRWDPYDVGRHPQVVGRHPQSVGRHPQDAGRRPQDVGRLSQDIGFDRRLKKRPAEDRTVAERTPAERIAAERISNRVSDRVADRLRVAAKGNYVVSQHDGSTADAGWYVHVGGLSFSTTFTDLAKRFAAFGNVTGFKIIFNHITCKTERASDGNALADAPAVVVASTGFAFISFEDEEGMLKAIEGLNDQVLDGHVLKVTRGRAQGKTAQGRHQKEIQPSEQLHRALKAPRRNPTGQQSNDRQDPQSQAYPAPSSVEKKLATERTPGKANRSTGPRSTTAKSKVNPTTPKATPAVMVERSAAAASADKATAPTTPKQEEIPAAGVVAGGMSAAETATILTTPKQETPAPGVGADETVTMPRATPDREDLGAIGSGNGAGQRNNGAVAGGVDGGVEKPGDRPEPATGATDACPQEVVPSANASSGDKSPGDSNGEGSRDGSKQRSAEEDDKGTGGKYDPGDRHEEHSGGDNKKDPSDGDKHEAGSGDAKGPGGGDWQGPGSGDVRDPGDGGIKGPAGDDANGADVREESVGNVNAVASAAGTN